MASSTPAWHFNYIEDPADETSRQLGLPPPLRPVVATRLVGSDHGSPRATALVDSGSERTLAAPGFARSIGQDLSNAVEVEIGIGGQLRRVRFAEVTVQLYESVLDDDAPPLAEWRCDVGFFSAWAPPWSMVLGRSGFFDHFTVTGGAGFADRASCQRCCQHNTDRRRRMSPNETQRRDRQHPT